MRTLLELPTCSCPNGMVSEPAKAVCAHSGIHVHHFRFYVQSPTLNYRGIAHD